MLNLTQYYFASLNVISFCTYTYDKLSSKFASRRNSERQLCILALFGGWPGGLLSMGIFNHKLSKTSFLLKFLSCSAINFYVIFNFIDFEKLLPSIK